MARGPTPTFKRTAHHEAGHAVAALLFGEHVYALHVAGRRTVFVDRRGRETRGSTGLLESSLNAHPPELVAFSLAHEGGRLRDAFRVRALQCVFEMGAGPIFECLYQGGPPSAAGIIETGSGYTGDHAQACNALAPFIEAEACPAVVWKAWEAAAIELATSDARLAVAAIAGALIGRGPEPVTMDGEEVEALARAAMPGLPHGVTMTAPACLVDFIPRSGA